MAEHSQLQALTTRYPLLQNGHLDVTNGRVPDLPRPVRGWRASLFNFFSERRALATLQPQFAGSLALPDSLRHQDYWEQQQWLDYQPFELSGFEQLQSYPLQEAVNDAPEQAEYNNFFVRNAPRYYALGQGCYWLKDLGSLASGSASTAATRQGRW